MSLAQFIRSNLDGILDEWEQFARSLLPETEGMSVDELRDHAKDLLRAIATDMETSQTSDQQSEKSKGHAVNSKSLDRAGDTHGIGRIEQGFQLEQIVAEYRALRASVIRLWERAVQEGERADSLGVTRFHEAIDQALASSVVQAVRAVTKFRDLFIGVLGHDLRGPLQAIQLSAATLARSEAPADNVLRAASVIMRNSKRMGALIGDLLDLTRTRFGKTIPLSRLETNLGELARSALDELEASLPNCTVQLASSGDLDGSWDGERICQLISNLVTNACRHATGTAPVQVETRGEPDSVVITVHNEGEPIPETMIPIIFDPLVQGAGTAHATSPRASLGLGLFIVKTISEAHGGTVEVQSTGKEGTTFTVRLPRRR